jgi:hypothetical protein
MGPSEFVAKRLSGFHFQVHYRPFGRIVSSNRRRCGWARQGARTQLARITRGGASERARVGLQGRRRVRRVPREEAARMNAIEPEFSAIITGVDHSPSSPSGLRTEPSAL